MGLSDGVTSSTFEFKTLLTDARTVQTAVVGCLADVIDAQPAVHFAGADAATGADAPAYPIVDRVLGADIERPDVRNRVDDFVGGLAIVLDSVDPAVSEASLRARLSQASQQAAFSDTAARARESAPMGMARERGSAAPPARLRAPRGRSRPPIPMTRPSIRHPGTVGSSSSTSTSVGSLQAGPG